VTDHHDVDQHDERGQLEAELEHIEQDDAIIGVAFRWSIIVFVIIVLIGGGIALLLRGEEIIEETGPVDLEGVEALHVDEASMPVLTFVDIAEDAGIDFVHRTGARGDKLLPETMYGGVAFYDHERDGDQDLLFVRGTSWPHDDPSDPASSIALYTNDGRGNFTDITSSVGLATPGLYAFGPAVADIDNDGDADLFIACLGRNRLFRNDDGMYVDITETAGVSGDDADWSTSAGFFDYDNDGQLDLFVCNYVEWSREIDIENEFTMNGRDRAYGPPTNFRGAHSRLYRNIGNGRFLDVSADAGVQVVNPFNDHAAGKALAFRPADVDGDGWMDIVVACDTVQNFLFHNQGDGTFVERGDPAGLAFSNEGSATGAMGIDAAVFRDDGATAFAIGNFAKEMTSFYVAKPTEPMFFTDESNVEGIGSPSRIKLTFGLVFFDADLDGRLDIVQANGHLENEIQEIFASQTYRQAAQLFWNCGMNAPTCYAEMPEGAVGDLSTRIVGRGLAYADIDADGDVDLVLTQTDGRPLLLRNDQDLGHHWLRFELRGTTSNRDAIGAVVSVKTADGRTQRQTVMPTRSYLSQVEPILTFGLGEQSAVDEVTVRWPSGRDQVVEVTGVDQVITVEEPVSSS